MSKLMLIDAGHPEETRVALVTNEQVDDFDFETSGRQQLRGNIYLAKITRVEPSLQAAFVEYGGNRHGFLAFSEIHPDYYQLPQADREALLREAAEAAAQSDEFDIDDDDDDDDEDDVIAADTDGESDDDDGEASAETGDNASKGENAGRPARRPRREPRNTLLRKYKIQEVIRRRQVLLVQVVKEERGNKGAALTTYLSLAGRYSVLMPNTPRGGGISRKIANGTDRKRLKAVMNELEVPEGMGLIVRTAGAKRTRSEIRRDYDYLIKLWDTIREKTLNSMAPCLVNEEGGLVHRAMRDMFDKDIEEVLIEGDEAYREAKELAKILMPSQAKKVKAWKEDTPLFVEERIEDQLDSIFSPEVQLKSGGYLIINQTEALVAVDVNSGKSTKARNIEQTALQTNMEAAEEVARQMRLRDLAGLIVIDFIDMDENKNNRAVEKKLKDCLALDRSRVQCGRISQFGLMEISRQRRRAGFLQATSDPCPTCKGTGRVRSVGSAALQLVRALQARVATGGLKSITVEAPTEVALYLLNHKRDAVAALESTAGFAITITSSETMMTGEFSIQSERDPDAKPVSRRPRRRPASRPDSERADTSSGLEVIDAEDEDDGDEIELAQVDEDDSDAKSEVSGAGEDEDAPKRKSRRRGRRGGRRRRRRETDDNGEETLDAAEAGETTAAQSVTPQESEREVPVLQTRPDPVPEDGGAFLDGVSVTAAEVLSGMPELVAEAEAESESEAEAKSEPEAKPKSSRRRRGNRGRGGKTRNGDDVTSAADAAPDAVVTAPAEEAPASPPVAEVEQVESEPALAPETDEADTVVPEAATPVAETAVVDAPAPDTTDEPAEAEASDDDKAPKRGWWARRRA